MTKLVGLATFRTFAKHRAMRSVLWIVLGGWAAVIAGCVLGSPDEPGCSEDAECDEGLVCRAGACVSELKASPGGVDAGSDGDAGQDAN
ncbi:MAG: hypothetical protein IPK82_14785 [Polyangiaceae bacterium]|nr:hypothetical protein [Polyangiaceae bacterium]